MHIIAFNSGWNSDCMAACVFQCTYTRQHICVVNSTNIVSVLLKMSLWTFTMNPMRSFFGQISLMCVFVLLVIVLCEMPIWLTSELNVWRSHLVPKALFIITFSQCVVCFGETESTRMKIRVCTERERDRECEERNEERKKNPIHNLTNWRNVFFVD